MPISNSKKVSQKGLALDPALSGYTPAFRYLWRVHMQSCLRRGVQSQITPSQFYTLITSNCHYCGVPPENETKLRLGSSKMKYNGVDRVDNEKPYNLSNLVTCCKTCNSMKSKLSATEFLGHIKRIYRYQHSIAQAIERHGIAATSGANGEDVT